MTDFLDGVSVITPFFNGNRYINETIRSVATQSSVHGPIEIILCVDHGSEMPEIDSSLTGIVRIVKNDQSETGAGVARYVAVRAAKMRYLAFLDADDLWTPDKLETQLNYMKKHGLAFCFGGYSEFSEDRTIGRYIPSGPYDLRKFLLKSFTVGCLTVVVDKKFDLPVRRNVLRRRNDYYTWYYMLEYCEKKSLAWGAVPEVIGRRRLHDENSTKGNFRNLIYAYQFYRAVDFSIGPAIALTFSNAVHSVLRKAIAKLNR